MTTTLLTGDCRAILPTLPANSVHCVVTSPPYYGLRDYQTASWSGGDPACDHQAPNGQGTTGQRADRTFTANQPYRSICGRCGAIRSDAQIGLEASPADYIAQMVEVFRLVRRVLRPDGCVFLNLGDSYADGGTGANGRQRNQPNANRNGTADTKAQRGVLPTVQHSLSTKQLLMMPSRVALALQADGWWLRSAITWCKANPMPESASDRCTSATEMVYMLTKRPTYYFDQEAIRTETGANARNWWLIATAPFSEWTETSRRVRVEPDAAVDGKKRKASPDCPVHGDRAGRASNAGDDAHAGGSLIHIARSNGDLVQAPAADCVPSVQPHKPTNEGQSSGSLPLWHSLSATPHSSQSHRTGLALATSQPCSVSAQTGTDTGRKSASPSPSGSAERMPESNSEPAGSDDHPSARMTDHSADMSSCCCEWYITKTEKTSHFATMPTALVERCIKAGTSERGVCQACGAPWVRQVERESRGVTTSPCYAVAASGGALNGGTEASTLGHGGKFVGVTTTTGWSPSCFCCRICDEQQLSSGHASQRPRSGENLAQSLGQTTASGPGASCEAVGEREQVSAGLQTVRQRGYRPTGSEVLQQDMRCEMDVGNRPGEPFQPRWDGEIQGEARQREDEIRPPIDNGEASRSAAGDERARPSSKRRQGRQSDREPRGAEAEHTRKDAHNAATGHELTPYDIVPAVVLDCFGGAGTVGLVADRLQRDAVLIELNPAYAAMAHSRVVRDAPLFATVTAEAPP